MKRKRFFSLILVFVLMFSLTGCDLAELFLDSAELEQIPSDHAEQRYDTEAVKKLADNMRSVWATDGQEDNLKEQIQTMLRCVDEAAAVYFRAEMQYYQNWNDKDLQLLHEQTQEDYYVVHEAAEWTMANGTRRSAYQDLFKPYADEDNINYYITASLNKVTSAARSSSASDGRFMDSYYSTAYDPDQSTETSNAACAKLYLDAISDLDTKEYLYDQYLRDYTVEDTARVYRELVEKLVPVMNKLESEIEDDVIMLKEQNKSFGVDDPFKTIQKYADRISPDFVQAINRLIDENRCVTAKGDACFDGSYTVGVPAENSALIYLYLPGGYSDLADAVHEFGHFYADCYDSTPTLLRQSCMDIAEIQSQGLAMLFTHFYQDLYGDNSRFIEKYALFCLLDSIISGFAVGNFEYEVMKNKDTMTPDDVLECYKKIHDECGLSMDLYQIVHLYSQPGYYVSYGASALAALQIYTTMLDDYQAAVSKYEKIAHIPSSSAQHRICGTLKDCGFSDIFTVSYLDEAIKQVTDRIAVLNQQ